jgi:hypothetical protein
LSHSLHFSTISKDEKTDPAKTSPKNRPVTSETHRQT